MRLRTNEMFHLGVQGSDNVIRFSPYIVVKKPDEFELVNVLIFFQKLEVKKLRKLTLTEMKHKLYCFTQGSQKPSSSTVPPSTDKFKVVSEVSLTKACQMVITCLSSELDWRVLKLVLSQVF